MGTLANVIIHLAAVMDPAYLKFPNFGGKLLEGGYSGGKLLEVINSFINKLTGNRAKGNHFQIKLYFSNLRVQE